MRLLVLTDLDGTLLDHGSYDFSPALPMLRRLSACGVAVVPATSKTAAEIGPLRESLGIARWPAIVENGAALFEAEAAPQDTAPRDAAPYARLRAALAGLAAPFRGFGDMEPAEIAALTGLSLAEAGRARIRAHSEPGLWTGAPGALPAFLEALAARGIAARQGGRFLTLSFGGTKADRIAELVARYRPGATVALGDAPNDIEMLEACDHAIILRNDHGPGIAPLRAEPSDRIYRTRQQGPKGWAEGMSRLLARPEFADLAPSGAVRDQTDGETDG
ncbi:HAD-IIB family hydrolase [Pseudogemmobacter sonorensis]|uniref:HAD-IIB family hydrolase n=1 Tax=Pseudogemmobacter sonorensis TaxID=2989681 RepID=UPI0036AC7D0A